MAISGRIDFLDQAVAEGVLHGVVGQLVGDRGHDHALVEGEDAAGDQSRRDIHGILESELAVDRESRGQGPGGCRSPREERNEGPGTRREASRRRD